MSDLIAVEKIAQWTKLKMLVLDSVSSPITKRVYSMALSEFMTWFQQAPRPGLTGNPQGPPTPRYGLERAAAARRGFVSACQESASELTNRSLAPNRRTLSDVSGATRRAAAECGSYLLAGSTGHVSGCSGGLNSSVLNTRGSSSGGATLSTRATSDCGP